MGAEFWVGVSFFVFLGILAFLGVHKKILAALDGRGSKIAAQLAEADRLRGEAAALLKSYEEKRRAAEKDAEAIVAAARDEAQRLEAEAKARLEEFVKRRTAQAEQKIAQAEAQATADVRAAAAELATGAAGSILAAAKPEGAFEAGLAQVKARLN